MLKETALPNVGEVTVRVLSCREKICRVKEDLVEYMKEQELEFPDELPYKAKAIFLFQKIDNVDVCFFGYDLSVSNSCSIARTFKRMLVVVLLALLLVALSLH